MAPSSAALPRLGIDISKLTIDVHLCASDGRSHSAAFANNNDGFAALDAWLALHRTTKTCAGVEATGPYGVLLLRHLHTSGHLVHQLDPRRVKDYARSQGRRVKTDAIDAAIIAAYLKASEHLLPWQPPTQALQDLQALVRRRAQLLDSLQAERNRQEKNLSSAVMDSLQRQITTLKAEVTQLDRAIDAHVLAHLPLQRSVRLLRSIDGVGRMSKEGGALLRKMLYMAALQAVKRTNNAFHEVYTAFVERGKAKMCALGAIKHKIMRVAFGVRKHDTPFVANFAKIEA